MANEANTKVRLVRCPRCREILQELAEVPIYKCGGCGTILQAKKRKNEDTSTKSCTHETTHANIEQGQNSVEKDICSLPQEAALSPLGDTLQDESNKRNHDEFGDCNKQCGEKNSYDELHSLPKLGYYENKDNFSSIREPIEQHGDECHLNGISGGCENQLAACCKELTGERNFSDKLPNSNQLKSHEASVPFTPPGAGGHVDKEKFPLDLGTSMDQNDGGTCEIESPESRGSLSGSSPFTQCIHHDSEFSPVTGVNAGKGDDQCLSQQSSRKDQSDSEGLNAEYIENVNSSREIFSTELACDDIDMPSQVHTEANQSPSNESSSSESAEPIHHEHHENSDKESSLGFDHISSTDTLQNLLDDSRSQATITHTDMSKSSTTRSYYAYDGSTSSCDGDDQVPNQFTQQYGQIFGNTGFISPDAFQSDYVCTVNNMLRRKSKTQHQAMNFSPMLPQMIQQVAEGSNQLESRRHVHAPGNRKQLEKDEYVTALPFVMTGSHTVNEHGSPSAYSKNVVHHQSDFNPSSMITDPEPDRMELLRMVYELEDQLRETRLGNGKTNDMFHAGGTRDNMHVPFFYDQFAPQADLNYSKCPVRCGQGKGFPKQFQSSRVPFSGEAAHYRHQANCLCLHCSPQVSHCSAQLPQGCIYCNNVQTMACSDHNYCNTHHSSSSSPQHYTSSEYSVSGHETKSSDQRHKYQEMQKLHLREKYAKRRHVLPVAGGAPIIVCHYCSELLQMPADFALFRRRCHQVRCNACMKVLKFSVQNRIHVIPYLTETLAPPPSEVDDISNTIKGRNQAPHYCPHAESVSYSDDLRPSFCQSCSSEAEASPITPAIQPHGRNTLNRKMSSASSSEPMEDRKMKSVMTESERKPWNSNERPSFKESKWGKLSSESEEALPRTGSPLHRLMGYSSLSQVLNG